MRVLTKKRRLGMIVAAVIAMCCFATPAFADDLGIEPYNNHGDTGWSAYLTNGNSIATTPYRQKQDASSGYIKLQTINGNRQVWAWMELRNGGTCRSSVVTLAEGNAKYVSNYAYEDNGYKPIQVVMKIQPASKTYSGATVASGVWSPDSV